MRSIHTAKLPNHEGGGDADIIGRGKGGIDLQFGCSSSRSYSADKNYSETLGWMVIQLPKVANFGKHFQKLMEFETWHREQDVANQSTFNAIFWAEFYSS